jgi:hypothetical protein
MIIEPVFDSVIARIKCDDELIYRNEDLIKSVNSVLNLPDVKYRTRNEKGDSHVGGGTTSVGQMYLPIIHLPGASELTKWVTKSMLEAKNIFGIDKPANSISYKRSWANRMSKGAQGKCHRHIVLDNYMATHTDYSSENFRADIVGIFYVDVPPNSADLIFIKDGIPDALHTEFKEEDKYYLKPITGELVLHTPNLWHAVGVHNSDLPRNVFVFDADYVMI